MGQKVIPVSFRLTHLNNWKSSWIAPKSQYADLFYFEHNIRKLLQTLTNRKWLNCDHITIKRQGNSLQIFVFVQNQLRYAHQEDLRNLAEKKAILTKNLQRFSEHLNLNVTVKLYIVCVTFKSLNRKKTFVNTLQYLRKDRRNHRTKDFFNAVCTALYTGSAELFNQFLVKNLVKSPRHIQFLKQINILLFQLFNRHPNFLGYKIQWKGRLNGRERGRKKVYSAGSIPLSTLDNNIIYDYQKVVTPAGVCGLKTWLFFAPK
jgi:flagellar biosynthesis/type III secretory pathway chaperone